MPQLQHLTLDIDKIETVMITDTWSLGLHAKCYAISMTPQCANVRRLAPKQLIDEANVFNGKIE